MDDDSAESVYHRVAAAICARRKPIPPPPPSLIREGLRLAWLGDGGENYQIGQPIKENQLWLTKAKCVHAWECWWAGAKTALPPCRKPCAPIPVLVNNLNVLVAILSEEALPT
jgi:hypothetical protein